MTFRLLAHPLIFCGDIILDMVVITEVTKRLEFSVVETCLSGVILTAVTEVGK